MAKKKSFKVGDKVQLTGAFLRSTGQFVGNEGQRKFLVRECECSMCARGQFVLTDQPTSELTLQTYTLDELQKHPHLRFRHIAVANLQKTR